MQELVAPQGFRSDQIPGLLPSKELQGRARAILEPLGDMHPASPNGNGPWLTKLALETCIANHLTFQQFQSIVMPHKNLAWPTLYRKREELWSFLGTHDKGGYYGELRDLKIASDPDMRTGKWVHLLDGKVIYRLMTCINPTMVDIWASCRRISDLLGCLRKISWSPEINWAFPKWYQRRVYRFLLLGKKLKFGDVFQKMVLPFLACLSDDEVEAAFWGYHKLGDPVEYYSKSHKGWIRTKVTATDPDEQRIMVGVKYDYWLSVAEQKELVRGVTDDPGVIVAQGPRRNPEQ